MSDVMPEPDLNALSAAILEFVGCMATAVPDVCSYGWTVGEQYVPFAPDDDEDCEVNEAGVPCSQLWVRIAGVTPAPGATDGWDGQCGLQKQVSLEVGVIRCFAVPEDGEAVTATEILQSAMVSVDDMTAIECAAMNCEVWDRITLGEWTPLGPSGGQYGGVWSFTATI